MRNRLKSLRERPSDTLFKRHTCHILVSLYFSLGIVKMKRLIAKFDVKLPSYLLVNQPESEQLRYETKIGDFDIEILLMSDGGGRSKCADEEDWSFCISHALISVARNEQVEPPPPRITEEGYIDYTVQDSYFEERLHAYQEVAAAVVKRVIRFFKYKLHNPFLRELETRDQELQNPEWTDETGHEVGKGIQTFIAHGIPGLDYPSFGIRKLKRTDEPELQEALKTSVRPKIYEEILYDAQNAVLQNNFRRAIIEMAIACEVAVKQTFFSKATPAGAAYEYLEDKGRINIRIIELIDGAARHAFGDSFKDVNGSAYQDIDNLFRCRNKVAHRGEAVYKDDSGGLNVIDRNILAKWWQSVEALFEWLNKLRS